MTKRGGWEEKEKQIIQVSEKEIAQQRRKRFQERRGAPETGGGGKEQGVETGGGRHRGNKVRNWEVGEWQGRRNRDVSLRLGTSWRVGADIQRMEKEELTRRESTRRAGKKGDNRDKKGLSLKQGRYFDQDKLYEHNYHLEGREKRHCQDLDHVLNYIFLVKQKYE